MDRVFTSCLGEWVLLHLSVALLFSFTGNYISRTVL